MDDNKKIISDDNISIKSSESVTTSGEYEIVPSIEADVNSVSDDQKTLEAGKDQLVVSHKIVPLSPVLASIGDIAELQKNMDEVIHEMDFEEAGELNHFTLISCTIK